MWFRCTSFSLANFQGCASPGYLIVETPWIPTICHVRSFSFLCLWDTHAESRRLRYVEVLLLWFHSRTIEMLQERAHAKRSFNVHQDTRPDCPLSCRAWAVEALLALGYFVTQKRSRVGHFTIYSSWFLHPSKCPKRRPIEQLHVRKTMAISGSSSWSPRHILMLHIPQSFGFVPDFIVVIFWTKTFLDFALSGSATKPGTNCCAGQILAAVTEPMQCHDREYFMCTPEIV